MRTPDEQPEPTARLRWRAEELARSRAAVPDPLPPLDIHHALHELKIHQIELEVQNEELRRSQKELEAARVHYFDLYDIAPVGYLVVSREGLIQEANLRASELLETPRAALVQQPITRFILGADQETYYQHRKQFIRTGKRHGCDLRLLRRDGTTFWAHLESASGQPAQVDRVLLSEITERKRVEAALARSKATLRGTQQLARIGSWEWDPQSRTGSWSEEVYRLHELRPGAAAPSPDALARCLECYLAEDSAALEAAFRSCLAGAAPCDLTFRITTAKGRRVWLRHLAEAVLEGGTVVLVTGYVMEISDRRGKERG